MNQEPKSIYEFKKGDKITRIKPSKPVAKIGDDEITDRNFIGTPFIFIGIANGCIYLKRILNESTKEFISLLNILDPERDSLLHLELDIFDEGWAPYIDPLTLGEPDESESKESINELEKKIKDALDKEDFEEAARLKKIIESKK